MSAFAAFLTVTVFAVPDQPGLNRDYWTNQKNKLPSDLITEKIQPAGSDVVANAEGTNWENPAQKNNFADRYAQRLYGYVIAPEDGDYIFCVAVDDVGVLRLSTDENPENLQTIVTTPNWCPMNNFNYYRSKPVSLKKGEKYYIQADMCEKAGGDHFQIAWIVPGTKKAVVIPGVSLRTVK